MNLKRLFAALVVLAMAGCAGGGPTYPDPDNDDPRNRPGEDGNPSQGSLIVDSPVSWV